MGLFQYWTGSAWSTDSNYFKATVNDRLYMPMTLSVTIVDPSNAKQYAGTYSVYQKVRFIPYPLTAAGTNGINVLFYGKITKITSRFDQLYGQVLDITAADNLHELARRTIGQDYSLGATRRSTLISAIINDYSYNVGGVLNVNPDAGTGFTASADTGFVANTKYDGGDLTALSAMKKLAKDDTWTGSDGRGYAYYLNPIFSSDAPTPKLQYFKLGSLPANPAAVGMQIELNLSAETLDTAPAKVNMHADYEFHPQANEEITHVRIEWVDDSVDPEVYHTELMYKVYTGTVSDGPFVAGEVITGSSAAITGTVRLVNATEKSLIISQTESKTQDSPFTNNMATTGSTSGATATTKAVSATPPGVASDTYGTRNEVSLSDFEIQLIADAAERVDAIITQSKQSAAIFRGQVTVTRWPRYATNVGSSPLLYTYTRVGTQVYIKNSNIAALADGASMVVTGIEYNEAPGSLSTRISLAHAVLNVANSAITDLRTQIQIGKWKNATAAMHGTDPATLINNAALTSALMGKGAQAWTSDITISPGSAYNTISWASAGVGITFADGTTEAVASGSATLNSPGDNATYYLYKSVGTAASTTAVVTGTLANALNADNKIMLANIRVGVAANERPTIFPFNSMQPSLSTAVLNVLQLSAVTADMGEITTGKIKNAANTIEIDADGKTIAIGASAASITPTAGKGIFLGSDGSSDYDVRIGEAVTAGNKYLHWDGSAETLVVSGSVVLTSAKITDAGVRIASVGDPAATTSIATQTSYFSFGWHASDLPTARDTSYVQLGGQYRTIAQLNAPVAGTPYTYNLFQLTWYGGANLPSTTLQYHDMNRGIIGNLTALSSGGALIPDHWRPPSNDPTEGYVLALEAFGDNTGYADLPWGTQWKHPTLLTTTTAPVDNDFGIVRYTTDGTGSGADTLGFLTGGDHASPAPTTNQSAFWIMQTIAADTSNSKLILEPSVAYSSTKNQTWIGWNNPLAGIKSYYIWAGDGAAGYPTHTFYNDYDTGMYSGGANVLEFATSGRKAISLNSSTLIFYQDADPYGATITFYRSTGNVSTIGNVSASGYVSGAAGIAVGSLSLLNRIDDASNGSGSTTLYIGNETITTSSDKRIKKDITSFTGNGLALTSQLPVKEFAWNDPSDPKESKNARGKYMGFIAQEVADIVPWAVNTQGGKDCEDCKAGNECEEHPIPWLLNYSYIVPVLVKAVQELTEKVKRLEEGN